MTLCFGLEFKNFCNQEFWMLKPECHLCKQTTWTHNFVFKSLYTTILTIPDICAKSAKLNFMNIGSLFSVFQRKSAIVRRCCFEKHYILRWESFLPHPRRFLHVRVITLYLISLNFTLGFMSAALCGLTGQPPTICREAFPMFRIQQSA